MKLTFTQKKSIRRSFGKLKESLSIPNLIEVQKDSYNEFLNSRAKNNQNSIDDKILKNDKDIDQIIYLDRNANKKGSHDGLGFFRLVGKIRKHRFDKVFIFNSSLFMFKLKKCLKLYVALVTLKRKN